MFGFSKSKLRFSFSRPVRIFGKMPICKPALALIDGFALFPLREFMQTTKSNSAGADSNISREKMIELLNEDLAREYQAIIAYTVYSQVLKGAAYTDIARELEKHAGEELSHALKISKQIDYLGGTPTVVAKSVKLSKDPKELLRFDLENEQETVVNYRTRIRQAEAMGEFGLSETLRQIIAQEQEHEIDLADALGIDVPASKKE
jgi:bacterioferritin